MDRQLRSLAQRRAGLDADEARWLREAEHVQVWRPLGMVSMVDYLERVFGYAPRTARHRLQVARALEHLPLTTAALAEGAMSFSSVRELVRVATPATEQTWRDHVRGMNLRQIEEAVAGLRPGDLPGDPKDPDVTMHTVSLRLSGATFALWRQARQALDEEHGQHLDDDALVAAMCSAVSDAGAAATELAAGAEPEVHADSARAGDRGRARYQIALAVCPGCDRGWQDGAGARIAVTAAVVEQARCDAQHIGSLDGDHPERAKQDVPPSVRRFVFRRDHDRCQTPGCRSSRGVEIHHIEHRADGGSHDPSNLTLRCFACHAAHHRGALRISGKAPHHIVTTRVHDPVTSRPADPIDAGAAPSTPTAAGWSSRLDHAILRTQARDALVGTGWPAGVARAAVDEALEHLGSDTTLPVLVREAFRRCPKPRN